MVAYKP